MSERIKKAGRRYQFEFGGAMAAYLVVLFSATYVARDMEQGMTLTLLALSPMIPLVLACIAFFRFFNAVDERERRTIANLAAIALVVGIFAALTLGFLSSFEVFHFKEEMIWFGPFLILTWGVIRCFGQFRDR